MRKLAKFDFVINSEEFQLFCRPKGLDVEKALSKLPKLSPSQLYERIKGGTQADETSVEEQEKQQIEAQLTELNVFIKKIEPFLKQLKADLAGFLSKKQAVMQCYAGTAKILTDYEDLNLAQYTDLDAHKLVINSPESANLKESMLHTLENLRNPFTDLYHWVKGELYDLSAMKIVLVERQKIATRMREL